MGLRATSLAAVLLAVMTVPVAAGDKNPPFTLQTKQLPTVAPGQSAWQMLYWQGGSQPAYDFRLTVKPQKGLVVTYPSGRDFTSLYKTSTLAANDVDFTAFKLDIPVFAWKSQYLEIEVQYLLAGEKKAEKFKTRVLLPIEANQGDDYQMLTSAVGPIAENSADWVTVEFRGAAPRLDDFRVVVADAQGATISYPGGLEYTSLSQDNVLQAAETDFVAFHVDTTGMAASLYTLTLDVSYRTVLNEPKQDRHYVLLTVGSEMSGTGAGTPVLVEYFAEPLTTDIQRLQRGVTPEAVFSLNAGAEHAGRSYFLLGSVAGTSPGIALGEWILPLTPDAYFYYTALYPNSGVLSGSQGLLDSQGRAEARFRVAASLPLYLFVDKWTVYHAFVVLDQGGIRFASNWAPLTFVE